MVIDEIVDGDEPDTEDGFLPEIEDSKELGEFASSEALTHRRLKKVKVRYVKSRSSYTKTT